MNQDQVETIADETLCWLDSALVDVAEGDFGKGEELGEDVELLKRLIGDHVSDATWSASLKDTDRTAYIAVLEAMIEMDVMPGGTSAVSKACRQLIEVHC